jgi:hypothetical protein
MIWIFAALLAVQSVPVMPGSPGVPPMPWTQAQICEGTERPPGSAGVLDVRLGEPFAAALARSTFRFRSDLPPTGIHVTGERLDLRIRDGARLLELPGIGGMHNTALQVTEDPAGGGIALIGFHDQARPLTLAEALDRAVMLRRWFVAGGFRALPVLRGVRDSRDFQVSSAPNALAGPRDRARAEVMLADERLATPAMSLFRLRRGNQEVHVTLENWRRQTAVMTRGAASVFNACQGREWGLQVYLSAS